MLLTMDKDFNWKATCHLYQYIEDHEPPAQAFAPLNMWIVNGLNYFILEKSGLTLKDRISIAEDIQKILARMLNKFPNDAGKANSMGSLFLNYPGRLEADEARLENALNWFRKAKQWSNTDDTAAEALLGAGEALFELGRWSEMFQTYQELRGMELCFEDSTANMIESRISDCYKNLST
jgi:tetratricopeptide (TPR) repeat protein